MAAAKGGEGAAKGGENNGGRRAMTRSAHSRARIDAGTNTASRPPGASAGLRGGASGGTPNVYTGACA